MKNVPSILKKAKLRPTHRLPERCRFKGASLASKRLLNMTHFENCMSVFFLQTSIAELMEKMLSCEVHFVRCGFYPIVQTKCNTTKHNATQRNDMTPPSPKDFFLGRVAVIQTISNRASAGAHDNGSWPQEKL